MEVVKSYSKLMELWSELENFIKIPSSTCGCMCGKYGCDTYRTIINMVEDDNTHKFLMGLDDDLYSNVRVQILALNPVPPLEKMFNMI